MADDADRRFRDGIRHVKLSSVPREIQWELACHLDSHCHFANWKTLAERFGLPTLNIMSIEDRVCYTPEKSCTLLFFDECLNPKQITLDQLVRAFALIKNLACIHVLEKAFLNGDLKASNKNETNVMEQQTASLPAVIHGNAIANEESQAKKIFITYSEDSQKMVKLIYKWLRFQGCIVSLDILEGRLLQENKIAWYDNRFREANHIIILVSPQYAEDIAARGTNDLSPLTLYIHNRMQAEYLNNNCTNKRFIPIVLPGATKNQGPEWLMYNTITYHWPLHHRSIFYRIHDLLMPTRTRLQYTPIITISRT